MKLENEVVISKLEKLLLKEKSQSGNRKIKPMSVQELNRRIDISMEDYRNESLTEAKDLLAEMEKWS